MYKITVLNPSPLSSLIDLLFQFVQLILMIGIHLLQFLPTIMSNVLCARCNGARLVFTISRFTRSRFSSHSPCFFLRTNVFKFAQVTIQPFD